MPDFGLTANGLLIKRLEDIKNEIEDTFRAVFGNGINLEPTELFGQVIGVLAEREALLWELVQAVYDASYPSTSDGNNLDNVVTVIGIERLEATPSTAIVTAYGTETTVIPAGSQISVDGDPSIIFETDEENIIGPGTDEVQLITFSAVPDSGNFTLSYDGDETANIAFNDNAAAVEAALEALAGLTSVTVTGDFTAGFTVTFDGVDGEQDHLLLVEETNTLLLVAAPVTITIAETTPGVLPNVDMAVTATVAGAFPAYANTITVIESVVAGWDTANNALDANIGTDLESDPKLRIRRKRSLAYPGASIVYSILAKILTIDEVVNAKVFHNPTSVVDAFGRPPHSIEAVVLGGDDDEIRAAIWEKAPAGIELFGGVDGTIVDSQGITQDVDFSRPTEIDIYLEIDVTTTIDFPVGGDVIMLAAILAYAQETFSIGDDIVVHGSPSIEAGIVCDEDLVGITDLVFRVGTAISPTLDNNITIAPDEIGVFDSTRIIINII